MTRRETSKDIDRAAAAWVARTDRGPLTDAERLALSAWLEADARRQGAFARANAVMARADEARHSTLDSAYALRSVHGGRRQLVAAGVVAALGGVGLWGARSWSAPMVLRSSRGEVRRVPLSDGSSVTLNTASLLKVRFTPHVREVALLSGEALFNVASDRSRPFTVEAGDVRLQGGATSFVVRKDDKGPVRVMVQSGQVKMSCKGAPATLVVAANAAAVAPDAGLGARTLPPPVPLDADEVARRLSWQDGMLAFNGETVGEAAAEFARYSSTRIIIEDPALAAEPLSGLYASSDPAGFARGVALSFGARVVSDADGVHVVR
ncbi:FecR family protein [Caulobacter sp. LARHSG274]